MKNVSILCSSYYLKAAIESLRYRANNEASQSQQPYLFNAEDTVWWEIADYFEHELRQQM